MESIEIVKLQLEKVMEEHRELDYMIEKMMEERVVNQIAVQRLKKRK